MENSNNPTPRSLHGKIALVTGGSRSLGRDIALRLAESGADVLITYRSEKEKAEEVVQAVRQMDRRAEALRVDLTGTGQIASFEKSLEHVLGQWGKTGIDILINNAGVGSYQKVTEATEEEFDRIIDTNFKSVVFLTQALLPLIQDGGRIISIGSGLARFALPGYAIYGSMKAALEQFMRYLAAELGPRGITANAISPGALDTDFNADSLGKNQALREFIGSVTALGRVGKAEDVGGVVAMLCSPAGGWITGQRIEVSGGMFL